MLVNQMPDTVICQTRAMTLEPERMCGWRRDGRGRGRWGLNRGLEREDQAREEGDILIRDSSLEKAWRQPGRSGSRERATQETAGLCGASRQADRDLALDLTLWGLGASDGFCVVSGRIQGAVRKGKVGGEAAGGWRTCVGDEQWPAQGEPVRWGVLGEHGSKGTPGFRSRPFPAGLWARG